MARNVDRLGDLGHFDSLQQRLNLTSENGFAVPSGLRIGVPVAQTSALFRLGIFLSGFGDGATETIRRMCPVRVRISNLT
jgi:hypothetical protein